MPISVAEPDSDTEVLIADAAVFSIFVVDSNATVVSDVIVVSDVTVLSGSASVLEMLDAVVSVLGTNSVVTAATVIVVIAVVVCSVFSDCSEEAIG